MILIFGKHKMVKQWEGITPQDSSITYCESVKELLRYAFSFRKVVFFDTNTRNAAIKIILFRLLLLRPIKRWTGTDALNYSKVGIAKKVVAFIAFKFLVYKHLSASPWLADEIREFGFESDIWPTPTPLYFSAKNTSHEELEALKRSQEVASVVVYSNAGREWLYKTDLMLEIAENHPEKTFYFVGNPSLDTKGIKNVINLGVITENEMQQLIAKSHWLVRITARDGMPRMIIEALYYGLNVITNLDIAHTVNAQSFEDALASLNNEWAFNREGRNYALNKFSPTNWVDKICSQ